MVIEAARLIDVKYFSNMRSSLKILLQLRPTETKREEAQILFFTRSGTGGYKNAMMLRVMIFIER